MHPRSIFLVVRIAPSRRPALILAAGILACLTAPGWAAAQVSVTSAALPVVLSNYLSPAPIHPLARDYLFALGNRLTTPGNERVTYQGSYTDSVGAAPATLVWQLPGYLLLTLPAVRRPAISIP
jgi:hypothetical protein